MPGQSGLTSPENFGLNIRQVEFAEHYLQHFNQFRAYKHAGYACDNKNSAYASSSKLLNGPKIQRYLAARLEQRKRNFDLDFHRTVQETARLAFSNLEDVIDIKGGELTISNLEEIPPEVTPAIQQIQASKTEYYSEEGVGSTVTRYTIRMHPKESSLAAMRRILGLDSDLNQALAVLQRYGIEVSDLNLPSTAFERLYSRHENGPNTISPNTDEEE